MNTVSTQTQTQFIETEGGRVAFEDTGGNGPAILAIPGMGDLRSEYRMIRPFLQQAGYRVITIDARGFGDTSATWDDYSARAVGRDAVAVLKHLDTGAATILGNSFAAGSALWAAKDAPEHVNGVVLLGPIVRDLEASFIQKLSLKVGFAGPWKVGFWTMYWNTLFPTRKPADHAQVKAAITQNLREPGRMDALMAMLALSKADTAAILEQTKVPTLVVMGTKDPDFADAIEEARMLAGKMKAETMIVDGAGHYPCRDGGYRRAKDLGFYRWPSGQQFQSCCAHGFASNDELKTMRSWLLSHQIDSLASRWSSLGDGLAPATSRSLPPSVAPGRWRRPLSANPSRNPLRLRAKGMLRLRAPAPSRTRFRIWWLPTCGMCQTLANRRVSTGNAAASLSI